MDRRDPSTRPSRRGLLAAVGASAGLLAGCQGGLLPGANTHNATRTPTRSPAPVPTENSVRLAAGESFDSGDFTVTVGNVDVRRIIATPAVGSSTHIDVAAFEGAQFVVADIRGEDRHPPPKENVGVVADGERIDGRAYPRDTFVHRTSYRWPLAIRVPVTRASEAAVAWFRSDEPAVRWTLPPALVDALGRVPAFEVRRFEVPERVTPGRAVDVTLEVANTGERDGTFLAEFGSNAISDVDELSVAVPEGAAVLRREGVRTYGTDRGAVTVVLDWGLDRLTREVAIEDG